MSRETCSSCGKTSNYDMGCSCDFPSKRYWDNVKTKKDYKLMLGSGMAWEFDPNFPHTWAEHERLKQKLFSEVK